MSVYHKRYNINAVSFYFLNLKEITIIYDIQGISFTQVACYMSNSTNIIGNMSLVLTHLSIVNRHHHTRLMLYSAHTVPE